MKTIEMILKKEMKDLNKIIESAEKRLKNTPQGRLRISNKKNKVEYYLKEDKKSSNGRYMKKSEENLARRIAQRDYDACVLKKGKERLKAIEVFLDKYMKTDLKALCQKMNPYRRELVECAIVSDEEFIEKWQHIPYEGKSFIDNEKVFVTEKGEHVRSKSEKIIADKLYMLGIPYRYEAPLFLKGNIKIHPDFTILRMPAREEVYLEHLGMMDDIDYVNRALYRFNTYEKNEIYLGVKLFITHETQSNPLNTQVLDKKMRELFCIQ